MTHVVTDICIKCKYTECVTVCPVNCFYEGENMLVINPEECIDCGVCIAECPVNAIVPESEKVLDIMEINSIYSKQWPNITVAKKPLNTAEEFKNIPNKYPSHFSKNPSQDTK